MSERETSAGAPGPGERRAEQALLRKIAYAPAAAWEEFLERFAPLIFKVACRFGDSYDRRMDLFVHVAERLREGRLRRLRAYRFRAERPRSFTSFLIVVARNLALDFIRSTNGRYRPFTILAGLDSADRMIFEYHIRDRMPLRQVRQVLEKRHGIRLRTADLILRSEQIERSLSPNQRWRLLSRLSTNRRPLSIDPTHEEVEIAGNSIPLSSGCANPEAQVHATCAREALRQALAAIEPRKRIALMLRFKIGLKVREAARLMGATDSQVEHWAREGAGAIRERLHRLRVTRNDLDAVVLEDVWTDPYPSRPDRNPKLAASSARSSPSTSPSRSRSTDAS